MVPRLATNGTKTDPVGALGAFTNIQPANTLWVDAADGNDSTAVKGRPDLPWRTIQSASSNMANRNVMWIRPGQYSTTPDPDGRFTFPNLGAQIRFQNLKDIVILAEEAVLKAAFDGNIILFQNVTNASLSGLEIEGAGANRGTNNFGAILLDGTNKHITIARNTIRNIGAHGVVTLHFQHASDYVSVENNHFESGGTGGIPFLSYDGTAIATGGRHWRICSNTIVDWFRAVELYSAETNEVAYNLIEGNVTDRIWECAIIVIPTTDSGQKYHHNTIANNQINGPGYPIKPNLPGVPGGIYLQGGEYNLIQNNNISNVAGFYMFVTNAVTGEYDTNAYFHAGGYGIRVGADGGVARHNRVIGNRLTFVRWRGIEFVGSDSYENSGNSAIGNEIYFVNDTAGIWLYGTRDATVEGNSVHGCPTGCTIEYSTNAIVVGNTFYDNGGCGLRLSATTRDTLILGNLLYGNNGGYAQLCSEIVEPRVRRPIRAREHWRSLRSD